ncbi:tRNA threonylcarbamoyladenosine biosynthesis protein TsaB [Oxalobacteraceae bacterium GrIS 2.11]
MPIILAIETSSEIASAALMSGNKLSSPQILQRQVDGVMTHSQLILPMVQSLFNEAGLRLSDCDAIAFGSGPGSFTGVRTACGVVQGLAFGADLPVIPVVTLLALAEAERVTSGAHNVLTALDARMGEVYWAQYQYDAALGWQVLIAPTLSAPALVAPDKLDHLVLAGNGFAAYEKQFTLNADLMSTARSTVPDAAAIVRIAAREWAAGRVVSAEQAQPLYLRNKIALTSAERLALAS